MALNQKDRLDLKPQGDQFDLDVGSNLSENIKLYCSGEFGLNKAQKDHGEDNYEQHDQEVD